MGSRVHKYLSKDRSFRVSCVIATQLVEEMRSVLHTYPIATSALGRSLMGCILMAAHQKEGHSVGLYFRGNGPLGVIFAEATYDGAARAYTANPQLEMPLKEGRLDVSGAIGHGLLEVVRGASFTNQLHAGTVIIKTGEIGDDIAYYLQQSQQIPSAMVLGVEIDEYGKVLGAGGIFIELFPAAPEKLGEKLENCLKSGGSLSKHITSGASEAELIKIFLGDFDLEELPHDYKVRYECRCSLEKVKNALLLLGADEIKELLERKKDTEASCDFCGRRYVVSIKELEDLHRESHKRSLN